MKRLNFQRRLVIMLVATLLLGLCIMPSEAAPVGAGFESSLGKGAVPEILKQYGGEHFLPIPRRQWVDEVFSRLVHVAERNDLEYTLVVLDSSKLNAFALPGGYVFITRGLVNAIGEDEAKLAAVLGHEIAHIERKHGVNAVLRQMGLTVLLEVGAIALDLASADLLRMASATLLQLLNLGWGREAEYEADLYGQALAVEAGFDGVGAIHVLDDLFSSSLEDLPMKVFRTHPDTRNRRDRLLASLASFWSDPVAVGDYNLLERLNASRNLKEDQRKHDPMDRYSIRIGQEGTGLEVFRQGIEPSVSFFEKWLEDQKVKGFAWSPLGKYLAVLIDGDYQEQLVICDRRGTVSRRINLTKYEIMDLSWSPTENQVAINVEGPGGREVLVTYLQADVILSVGGEFAGSTSIWLDTGLYFAQGNKWYHTRAPQVEAVRIPSPVPQVLQRQRILSPQVIKEGNTIRLTRPTLTIP